jgi:hypothetical protein
VQSKLRETVSVKDFGAVGDGVQDCSAAFTTALTVATHVIVPPGTYRCDAMVEVTTGRVLQLMGGATLIRKSANSTSIDPVVWVKGAGAGILGAGQNACTIKSENRAPKGVVRLGHKDMTESHDNVTYCSLHGFTAVGAVSNGQTTGDPDVALYMPNPQFGGKVSYYHDISGLRLQNANFGLWLHGWANGNTINNIQGYGIGNVTLGANKNAFIYCNGALDNAVSNCMFGNGANSIGLLIDNFDNTANGGSVHSVFANSFRGMVFEQGGASAVGVRSIVAGGSGFYEIRHNTAGGNSLPTGFTDSNIFIGLGTVLGTTLNMNTVTARDSVTATGAVSGGTVESSGDIGGFGSVKSGDSGAYYIAKKVKRAATTNASTLSFTLSCTAQASVYRHGYVKIIAAGGDVASGGGSIAEFLLTASALNQAFPTIGTATPKTSSGDVASFTLSAVNGVLTIASTLDTLVCEVQFGFTTTNVNIT